MSATNSTNTIELSQYISTDKPTYLVDYNGDMLKIDNAIAADRGSIGDVNTIAVRADGKADTNKGSIDTLNAQINGNPEDPADTGLAGKVTDNSSDIETMQSLIGNGTPTTSNQTIIGAINGLEGAVAPREDGADLANSYSIGEQFARGGSVYTALTSLTAGTAFASLTLNTDYKNSDTLVEQIADAAETAAEAAQGIAALSGYYVYEREISVNVTADSDTYGSLLNKLFTAMKNKLVSEYPTHFAHFNWIALADLGFNIPCGGGGIGTMPDSLPFTVSHGQYSGNGALIDSASSISIYDITTQTQTITGATSITDDKKFYLSAMLYKAI